MNSASHLEYWNDGMMGKDKRKLGDPGEMVAFGAPVKYASHFTGRGEHLTGQVGQAEGIPVEGWNVGSAKL